MSQSIPEPQPKESVAATLALPCPECFAHAGEWCATTSARNDYVRRLHPGRISASLDEAFSA